MTRQEQLNNEMFTALNEVANNKPFLNTEMGQYAYQLGFEKGAEIDRKILIDKVCEWLALHISSEDIFDDETYLTVNLYDNMFDFIKAFREAMEE